MQMNIPWINVSKQLCIEHHCINLYYKNFKMFYSKMECTNPILLFYKVNAGTFITDSSIAQEMF